MRRNFKIFFASAILLSLFVISQPSRADGPPPPPPGGGHGGGGNQPPGGGAPIDGGLSILLLAGAAYGGRKLYQVRNKNIED
jgi:hypothetical protein